MQKNVAKNAGIRLSKVGNNFQVAIDLLSKGEQRLLLPIMLSPELPTRDEALKRIAEVAYAFIGDALKIRSVVFSDETGEDGLSALFVLNLETLKVREF